MKPIFILTLFVFLAASLYQTATAQTYTIPTNVSSSYLGADGFSTCNNCVFNITPGVTFTVNTGGTCNSCTFNGGTVLISSSSAVNWNGTTTFNNDTTLIDASNSIQNMNFSGDSIAINSSTGFSSSGTTISNSRVAINASTNFQNVSFTNDSLHFNANFSTSNPSETFSGSNVDVAGGVDLSLQQTTFTNSVFAFSGSSRMSVNNSLSATGTSFYLGGTSTVSSSGTTTIQTSNVVLDGTINSFSANNLNTVTSSNIILNSSTSSSFSASSLTMTGTGNLIGEGTDATINIGNAINLSSTTLALSGGATLEGSSLTTSGGSIIASGSTIRDGNALSLTNTPTALNTTSLSASSITTSGSSFSATGSTISDGNALTSGNTLDTLNGTTINPSSISITGGSFIVSGASVITDGNAASFAGAVVSIGGTSMLTASSGSLTSNSGIDGSLTMSGSARMSFGNAFNIISGNAYMDGNSSLTANSMALSTNSFLEIGDGPLADQAFVKITNSFSTDNTSTVSIKNNDNYLYTTNNLYKNANTSCNGGGTENACQTDYVYGCATINNINAVGCVVLALADINLTAAPAGSAVTLTWSDPQYSTAASYMVQRSSNDGDWTTLSTVTEGGYTDGDYRFEDAAAPAGTDNYRIARVDQDGAVLYSAVSSVNITGTTGTNGAFSIYPNPASGHTFFISVPNTEQLTVNIYTVTGQLLTRQSLQGQLRYQLLLPSQLLPGAAVIVQAINQTGKQAFPLLLQ